MNFEKAFRIRQKWLWAILALSLWAICRWLIIPYGWEEVLGGYDRDLTGRMAWWRHTTELNRRMYMVFVGLAFSSAIALEALAFLAVGSLMKTIREPYFSLVNLLVWLVGLRLVAHLMIEYPIMYRHDWTLMASVGYLLTWLPWLVWAMLLAPLLLRRGLRLAS